MRALAAIVFVVGLLVTGPAFADKTGDAVRNAGRTFLELRNHRNQDVVCGRGDRRVR